MSQSNERLTSLLSFPPASVLRERLRSAPDLTDTRCAVYYDMLIGAFENRQETPFSAAMMLIGTYQDLLQAVGQPGENSLDSSTRALLQMIPFCIPALLRILLDHDPGCEPIIDAYYALSRRQGQP